MADRDKWFGAGLFVIGTLLVTGGVALEAMGSLVTPLAVAIAMTGFISFGLATALFIRWGTGSVTPQRVLAAVGTFAGAGIAVLGGMYLAGTARIAAVGIGLLAAFGAWYWNKRLIGEKDVATRDERVEYLTYKAAWRALQGVLFVVLAWYSLIEFTTYRPPTTVLLLVLLLIGTLGRMGLYRFYARHE